MPTRLRKIVIEAAPVADFSRGLMFVDRATGEAPRVGDVFYAPHLFDETRGHLSPHYWEAWKETKRAPIIVVLPTGQWWCVDELSWTKERGFHGMGWRATGSIDADPITLSVVPSILSADYHGTLKDGVLSDDRDVPLTPIAERTPNLVAARRGAEKEEEDHDQADAFPPD